MSPTIVPAARWRSAFSISRQTRCRDRRGFGLVPPFRGAYLTAMQVSKTKILTACARGPAWCWARSMPPRPGRRKSAPIRSPRRAKFGSGTFRATRAGGPRRHADHHAGLSLARHDAGRPKEPKEPSSAPTVRSTSRAAAAPTFRRPARRPIPCNSPPAAALTQPVPQPYKPPPITTFSDRVNSAIQAYPLEKGIGNNPIDQQQFIRQRVNQ